MIILKVVAYDNHAGLEATWLEQTQAPDVEVQVKCVSYHPTQMDMFRADAAEMGTDLTEYEPLMATIEAAYVPYTPTPEEIQQQINADALAYLAKTDWYVTRFAETGEPIPDEVKAKRQAARDSIK